MYGINRRLRDRTYLRQKQANSNIDVLARRLLPVNRQILYARRKRR